MDEVEPTTTSDPDTRRRVHHHRGENLQAGLVLGEIDETMTDLIFGDVAPQKATASVPSDPRGFVDH
jgi:hypothetical protein